MDTVAIQTLGAILGPFGVLIVVVVYLLLRRSNKQNGKGLYPTANVSSCPRTLEIDRRFNGLSSQVADLHTVVTKNNDYFMQHIQNVSIHRLRE